MAIQYALLSLGTGVISSSQVHDTFHTVHIYMYRVFMHKCIAQLQPSGRARVCICACMCIDTQNVMHIDIWLFLLTS